MDNGKNTRLRRRFMKKLLFIGATILILSSWSVPGVFAGPDQYMGDSAIYTGTSTKNKPYVLLIVDNSAATLNTASGQSYDHRKNYYSECVAANGAANCYSTFGIYYAGLQGTYKTNQLIVDNPGGTLNTSTVQGTLPNLACQNPGAVLTSLLGTVGDVATGGTYQGSATAGNPNLKYKTSSGTAICDTTGQGQAYALGNFLNYTLLPPPPVLVQGSDSLDYELIKSHTSGDASCNTNPDDKPNTGSVWQTYWKLKGAHSASTPAWQPCIPYSLGSDTQQKLIYDAVKTVVDGARYAVKFGAEIYGSNNSGGRIIKEVKDISANADFTSFLSVLPGGSPGSPVLSSNTGRPQAEALYDAYQYFKGQPTYFANPSQTLPKPQTSNCEKLYVILLTNGLPNGENKIALASLIGDYDNDGREPDATGAAYGQGTHYLDDMAKKMYDVGI